MPLLKDGFSTLVTFANVPSIKLWEKEVTPPGVSGGGATALSTMRNTLWRTMAPKKLRTLTPMKMTCAYDPVVYSDIVAQVNVNQLITVTFSDGAKIQFWGWMNEFTPGAAKEGDQPTAEVSVEPSNTDASFNEIAPLFIAAP